MAYTSLIKSAINGLLGKINLKIDTLTAKKTETTRLMLLEEKGHFDKPIFSIPPAFKMMEINSLLDEIQRYKSCLNNFNDSSCNTVLYSYDNDYFTSPDAEVLYTIVRCFRPKTVLEIGSGYSTKLTRQAILDGQLSTRLVAIDPHPRVEIDQFTDKLYLERVETASQLDIFYSLKAGDILFIDSSHEIKVGNDVIFLYLNILPILPPGVLIHIHDIFLPYDYPKQWVIENEYGWNEQYLVQALLTLTDSFDVLWAGHFLQRTLPNFSVYFPHMKNRLAGSLWLRKTR